MSKTLKVTCSGSFKASDGDLESFDNVVGIIPALDEDKAIQMVIRRYGIIWIGRAKKMVSGQPTDEGKYKRVMKVRQVFIDSIEENEENPNAVLSYVGKDVMDMNFEELQDFAAANDLSGVPLYKTCSLQHARRVAWSEAARKIHGLVGPEYMWTNQLFKPAQHEPIVADAQVRRAGGHVADIEETIDREALALKQKTKEETAAVRKVSGDASNTDSKLSLDQLKAIADEKKVKYHPTIGYKQLYDKIYATKKVA